LENAFFRFRFFLLFFWLQMQWAQIDNAVLTTTDPLETSGVPDMDSVRRLDEHCGGGDPMQRHRRVWHQYFKLQQAAEMSANRDSMCAIHAVAGEYDNSYPYCTAYNASARKLAGERGRRLSRRDGLRIPDKSNH
jgi:hypothetical protein